MRTYTHQEPLSLLTKIITEFGIEDVTDLSKSEAQFKIVINRVMDQIADALAQELTPRIKDYIIAKIDIEKLIQNAVEAKVKELLWPIESNHGTR